MVPIACEEKLRQSLQGLGGASEWKLYDDGGHWVNERKGVNDTEFMQRNEQSSTEYHQSSTALIRQVLKLAFLTIRVQSHAWSKPASHHLEKKRNPGSQIPKQLADCSLPLNF